MSGWGGGGVYVCVSASIDVKCSGLPTHDTNPLYYYYYYYYCYCYITCSCSPNPFFLELQHLVSEAHALLTDDVGPGHSDILKEDLCRVRAPHAHLVNLLGDVDAYTSNSLYLPVAALNFFLSFLTSVTSAWWRK